MEKWKCIAWGGRIEIRSQDNSETGIAFLGNNEGDRAMPSKKVRNNAYLMSAAPELLEACKAVMACVNSNNITEQINNEDAEKLSNVLADVYKATAKAECK